MSIYTAVHGVYARTMKQVREHVGQLGVAADQQMTRMTCHLHSVIQCCIYSQKQSCQSLILSAQLCTTSHSTFTASPRHVHSIPTAHLQQPTACSQYVHSVPQNIHSVPQQQIQLNHGCIRCTLFRYYNLTLNRKLGPHVHLSCTLNDH